MTARKPFFFTYVKVVDVIIIVLALGVSAFSAVWVYAGLALRAGPNRHAGPDRQEVVIQGPEGNWVFPLDAEEIIPIAGPLGTTEVELRGGRVRVRSSPCTNQICVAAGTIHGHGQWIACLPNKVLIRVEAKADDEELDAAAW
ncbi:MAG: NusG domain II-containing protein [Spirochaetaceae bacterium]|jgi:hypothetical protein|nr:NusG domain II-containing protein [Spirochaetaceae bacterium]